MRLGPENHHRQLQYIQIGPTVNGDRVLKNVIMSDKCPSLGENLSTSC